MAFFGASCDKPELNKKFAEKLALDFPLLSDPERKTAALYGILVQDRYSKRVTIFVDKEGKIAHMEEKVDVRGAGKQVVDTLKKLKFPSSAIKDD